MADLIRFREEQLRGHPAAIVSRIAALLNTTEPVSLDAEEISTDCGEPIGACENALEQLVEMTVLKPLSYMACSSCGNRIENEDEQECPSCGRTFDGGDARITEAVRYLRPGQRKRDIDWFITIHGMNTFGPWQERFSWNVGRTYRTAVPVAIYKYGHVIATPVIQSRQERFAEEFERSVRQLMKEAEDRNYDRPPDVLAHSFGTLLLARVIANNVSGSHENPIRLGRIILTGSVVRPDFDWETAIETGVVEAVLCHYSKADSVVPWAHAMIPDSGPSGRIGFAYSGKGMAYYAEESFGHSDYFAEKHSERVWNEVWAPFLSANPKELETVHHRSGEQIATEWKPRWWRRVTAALKVPLLPLVLGYRIASAGVGAIGFVAGSVGDWFREGDQRNSCR